MTLGDWLDAGYAFIIRDADPTARGLFDTLFGADSLEAMTGAFDALRAEMEWRRDEMDRIEAEARKQARKAGGRERPRAVRRVSQEELDAAVAVWEKAPEPAPGGPRVESWPTGGRRAGTGRGQRLRD